MGRARTLLWLTAAACVAAGVYLATAREDRVTVLAFDVDGDPAVVLDALVGRLETHGAWGDLWVEGQRVWVVAVQPVTDAAPLVAQHRLRIVPVVEPSAPQAHLMADLSGAWLAVDLSQAVEPTVLTAGVGFNQHANVAVLVRLDEAGGELFFASTAKHVGEQLAITLDDRVLMAPRVREPIPGGRLEIEVGDASRFAEARYVAEHISTGRLPAPIRLGAHFEAARVMRDGWTEVTGEGGELRFRTPDRQRPEGCLTGIFRPDPEVHPADLERARRVGVCAVRRVQLGR